MMRLALSSLCFCGVTLLPTVALAVKSAELYTAASYGYGRVETRLRFAGGDGVVSSFFLWKSGSEVAGTFWNELDIEKIGADCEIDSNAFYGNPASVHTMSITEGAQFCDAFHTYAYEWTPDAIAWFVDGVEVRRETGAAAAAFSENAGAVGMQIRLNVWPGDATFGGNFSPSILPVHQYVDWVQFSSYEAGVFTFAWREDFNGTTVPTSWLAATWNSPKNLSTHDPRNINLIDGYAVLSLTADDAVGPAGAMPGDTAGAGGAGGSGAGSGGQAGASAGAAGLGSGGAAGAGAGAAGGSAGSTAAPESEPEDDAGGCRMSPTRSANGWLGALGLAVVAALSRRRQGRRPGRLA
jgi:endo-1,3-1,4-beta-glycanase ExoK